MKKDAGTTAILEYLVSRSDHMLANLRELVELESPSHDKEALARIGRQLGQELQDLGGHLRFHEQHLQADFAGDRGKPLLLLGHMDTVWSIGTLATMPFKVEDGRAFGPGSFDMKAGIVQAIYAIRALKELRGGLPCHIVLLLVTDEEIGSQSSRPITEKLAREASAVLVLEPSHGPRGALKTARKGVGEYVIRVWGREAHSGLDFEKGASAVLELSRQLPRIAKFTDLERGITVNPGVIRGGTRTNVIAGEAVAEVDARVSKLSDIPRLDRKFHSLKAVDKRCRIAVSGGIGRPPLERGPKVAELFGLARNLARELGWRLTEASVGGGSDGNFTAGLGIPTLDGLGAVGDGAHARHEHVVVSEMPRRAALLASLIQQLAGSR